MAAWRQASETVGGLAADFAAEATHAAWRGSVMEVTIPATAATAVTFLRRPEAVASIAKTLSALVGRAVKHAVVVAPAAATPASPAAAAATAAPEAGDHAAPARRPAPSQAALVREAMDHPLVVQARTVLDAAIRKVEPPRRPAAESPPRAVPPGQAADELDHRDDDAVEPDLNLVLRGDDADA
jgi:hypothetical protein